MTTTICNGCPMLHEGLGAVCRLGYSVQLKQSRYFSYECSLLDVRYFKGDLLEVHRPERTDANPTHNQEQLGLPEEAKYGHWM